MEDRPTIAGLGIGPLLADRYELISHLARGGMSDVFAAEDRQLQRRVAVKVFRGAAAGDRARFDAEVVVLASLDHPGLVRVYDAGEHDGDAFVVLDLVDGPNLAARLAETGPFQPPAVAELGAEVADALAYVHDHGVVHRDVTPSNVLCGPDGRPRLADFGIARLVDTTRITATATTVGTAGYMAPEQVQGHDVTPAADVYALGLVLLELLRGRPAFTGTQHEVAVARLGRDPDTVTDVPFGWRELLSAMTDRDVANRPSAGEVRDRLRPLSRGAAESMAVTTSRSMAVDAPHGTEATAVGSTTRAMPAPPSTSVMPAALVPNAEPAPARGRAVLAALVGLLLLIGAVAASGGGGGRGDPQTPSTTIADAPAVSSPTSTTAAPTTEAPDTSSGASKKGKRKERGSGDD
jgi:serine/threonine protein kinase